MSAGKNPREDLTKTMERLDVLLTETKDPERLRMGMGIRLALGMAQEIRQGAPLGSQTGDMVASWTDEFGQDAVDRAVQVAREFLTRPEELKKALGQRLGLYGGTVPGHVDLEAGGREADAGEDPESDAETSGDGRGEAGV